MQSIKFKGTHCTVGHDQAEAGLGTRQWDGGKKQEKTRAGTGAATLESKHRDVGILDHRYSGTQEQAGSKHNRRPSVTKGSPGRENHCLNRRSLQVSRWASWVAQQLLHRPGPEPANIRQFLGQAGPDPAAARVVWARSWQYDYYLGNVSTCFTIVTGPFSQRMVVSCSHGNFLLTFSSKGSVCIVH